MRKSLIIPMLLCIGSLFTTSCSDEDDIVELPKEKTVLTPKQQKIFREKLDSTLVKMYSNNNNLSRTMSLTNLPQAYFDENGNLNTSNLTVDHYLDAIKKVGDQSGINVAPAVYGPFDVTSHYQLLRSNIKVAVYAQNGYPPTGYYFADVYKYAGSYMAPPEAISGFVDTTPTTKWGWGYRTENNSSEDNRGHVYSATHYGNYYFMKVISHSMNIKANMNGQTFSLTRPFNFRDAILTYNFYYFTL